MKKLAVLTALLLTAPLLQRCTDPPPHDATPFDFQSHLSVEWELISNIIGDEPAFRARFLFHNRGPDTLRSSNWALYFNQTPRDIEPASIEGPARIERLNGDFYRLLPTADFALPPGDSLSIRYEGSYFMVKECDAPVGLYFRLGEEEEDATLIPVEDYRVRPFERPEQYQRFTFDRLPFPDAQWYFERNAAAHPLPARQVQPVLPSPLRLAPGQGTLFLTAATTIEYPDELQAEAEYLAESLEKLLGTRPALAPEETEGPNHIVLALADFRVNGKAHEAYRLIAMPGDGVRIEGNDASGVFYGIQSLLHLLPVEAWEAPADSLHLPAVAIEDSPRFPYRGMHLDIARNFNDKAAILKLLEVMALYKLNRLHLHLTDDEGWRLQIPELPELTEVGAFRGHTLEEKRFLHPAYGSGPHPDPETSYGSGYLSRADFVEILRRARALHIQVIPEINMPGHARAAILAMKARYHRLLEEGRTEEAEAYLLHDPQDSSSYRSVQGYPDNVVCVCRESVYRFYETVVDALQAMYAEADAPLEVVHTGGDEVPAGVWAGSPLCHRLMEKDPTLQDTEDLADYFRSRLAQLLAERGLTMAGWEEIALHRDEAGRYQPNPAHLGKNLLPYVWNSLGEALDLGYRLANAGYPVVLCNVDHLYFDLAYDKHPAEPGYYWGGFVDTRKAFSFLPFDVLNATREDPFGNPIPQALRRKMTPLNPANAERIIGIQGQLWSETVKGPQMMEYYYLPKLLGLAERAWAAPPAWASLADAEQRTRAFQEAWNRFANALGQRELPRLEHFAGGFNFRLPPPGAAIIEGLLHVNVAFPGLSVHYTTDGSEPTPDSPRYTEPFPPTATTRLKTFDQRGRSSREVIVEAPQAQVTHKD
ncbi:MAG: beta-N-acetylhexosaminidase [Bacteroidetes bacterium]|nr:MAG: beta-N-acetylhexosaminidase [Bacteroidota bacterium]